MKQPIVFGYAASEPRGRMMHPIGSGEALTGDMALQGGIPGYARL
jgi:hypothetical protein